MFFKSTLLLVLCAFLAMSEAKPATQSNLLDISKLDLEHVECNGKVDMIDECGLQQGYTHRWIELAPPTNFTFLQASCKRQADAFKCLRAHAKCLPPLSKQVLLTMVGSRQKYNKKICQENPNEAATKLMDYNKCMIEKGLTERAIKAEHNSIITPEAIVNAKFDQVQDRIKQSCCSVAKARKEFMEASNPSCIQYNSVASDLIDSYLAETVGIICPDFENKSRHECDKLAKLTLPKHQESKSFIKPIIAVVQTLAP